MTKAQRIEDIVNRQTMCSTVYHDGTSWIDCLVDIGDQRFVYTVYFEGAVKKRFFNIAQAARWLEECYEETK